MGEYRYASGFSYILQIWQVFEILLRSTLSFYFLVTTYLNYLWSFALFGTICTILKMWKTLMEEECYFY